MANFTSFNIIFSFFALLIFFIIGIFGSFTEILLWIYAIIFISYQIIENERRRKQLIAAFILFLLLAFPLSIFYGGAEFHKFIFAFSVFILLISGLSEYVINSIMPRVKHLRKVYRNNQFYLGVFVAFGLSLLLEGLNKWIEFKVKNKVPFYENLEQHIWATEAAVGLFVFIIVILMWHKGSENENKLSK